MTRFSAFSLFAKALGGHQSWPEQWPDASPKPAYDAIIVGTGTRFGRMTSQMANFLDQAGGLWAKGALHGKVGGAWARERLAPCVAAARALLGG